MMKMSTDKLKEELAALDELSYNDIDYSDIPPAGSHPERVRNPAVGRLYKPLKVQKTLRLDSDLVSLFQSTGKGYQSLINEVLRGTVDLAEECLFKAQAFVQDGELEDACRLIAAHLLQHPSAKSYLAARLQAIALDPVTTESNSKLGTLELAIKNNPDFLILLEERVAEPALFLSTVQAAMELSDKETRYETRKKPGPRR